MPFLRLQFTPSPPASTPPKTKKSNCHRSPVKTSPHYILSGHNSGLRTLSAALRPYLLPPPIPLAAAASPSKATIFANFLRRRIYPSSGVSSGVFCCVAILHQVKRRKDIHPLQHILCAQQARRVAVPSLRMERPPPTPSQKKRTNIKKNVKNQSEKNKRAERSGDIIVWIFTSMTEIFCMYCSIFETIKQ